MLLEEARRYTIGYGIGLEALRLGNGSGGPSATPLQFSPRGTLEFTKLNLTGRADTLSFKIRASTLQGRAQLTYTDANYFGHPNLSLQLTGYYEKARDVSTFTSTRTEGALQLTDRLSTSSSLLFRYAYRHVLASDLQISPQEIPLFNQPTRVSLVGITWLRDRRDSPSDATRGSFNSVDADVAMRAIGSSASYTRIFLQNSTLHPHWKALYLCPLHARGRADASRRHRQPPTSRCPSVSSSAARTTLRGFGLNQAGPRDPITGFPIGGLGMLIFNQQLQFPMRLPLIGNRLGGAIFYDAGNVFTTFQNISLRYAPPKPVFSSTTTDLCLYNCTNQMNYFSHTVGFEFRYHTPIGPVSIDLAYQLNPARVSGTRWSHPARRNFGAHACAASGVSVLREFGGHVLMSALAAVVMPFAARSSVRRNGFPAYPQQDPRQDRQQGPAVAATPADGEVVDRIAARVEGDIIALSEVRELSAYQQLLDDQSHQSLN